MIENENQKNMKPYEMDTHKPKQFDEQEKRKKEFDNDLKYSPLKSKKFTERLFSDDSSKNETNLFKKWGLTPDQVAEAEKFIIEIEERVDECCPIRGSKKKLQKNHE